MATTEKQADRPLEQESDMERGRRRAPYFPVRDPLDFCIIPNHESRYDVRHDWQPHAFAWGGLLILVVVICIAAQYWGWK